MRAQADSLRSPATPRSLVPSWFDSDTAVAFSPLQLEPAAGGASNPDLHLADVTVGVYDRPSTVASAQGSFDGLQADVSFCGNVQPTCSIDGHSSGSSGGQEAAMSRATVALLMGSVSAAVGALLGEMSDAGHQHRVEILPHVAVGQAGGWFVGMRMCVPLSATGLGQ